MMGRFFVLLILAFAFLSPFARSAPGLTFEVKSKNGSLLPCRVLVVDGKGKPHHPEAALFWKGGFVCEGKAELDLESGVYRYEIERGPEWKPVTGEVELKTDSMPIRVTLERLVDLKKEGWYSGDLHVHRAPNEMPLHMTSEDLSVASVLTWWNKRNAWGDALIPKNPVKEIDGRFYHILGGEDERGGGALLYHRMNQTIDITKAEREWPASVTFLHQAKKAGAWAEIEKPFWWDTPVWLATGKVSSVGLAHNHMQRLGVLGSEAWGRARDEKRYPGVHGNGLYTQDLYYKILNAGLRLPPSAGSASGVLGNPVGYYRVYVHTGSTLDWDSWWEGLGKGRSFVTNGPLLRLRANGTLSGEILKGAETVTIKLEGKIDSNTPIDRIELVRSGVVQKIELPYEFSIETSGWFLVRAITTAQETFRFASTAPWYIEIGGAPMKPDRDAASFFLKWTRERRVRALATLKDETKRKEVASTYDEAIAYWDGKERDWSPHIAP